MSIEDDAKYVAAKAIDGASKGYAVAESKVDEFFMKNKFTVVILTGAAVALATFFIRATFFCG